MKLFLIFLISATVILFSCDNHMQAPYSLRDSVTEDYLNYVDSLGIFDTTETNYKLLKAYVNNDTSFLKDFQEWQTQDKRVFLLRRNRDSCVHQPRLQDMNVDEGYRFDYSAVFSRNIINITVTKKDTIINLHCIVYAPSWDSTKCHIISQYDKSLTVKNWEDLGEMITHADFWGLKKENGVYGADGDDLIMTGYIKRDFLYKGASHFNIVHRWAVNRNTVGPPFWFVLKLIGDKHIFE